jgi:hypothetical protein
MALVALLALSASLIAAGPNEARAQSADVFTIGGIEIDTTGENDLDAKRTGVAEAKAQAFSDLIARLTLEGTQDQLAVPSPDRLEFLIRDVTFDQEKFGGGRYLAELTVRFQPEAVRDLLQREGIAFAETKSRPLAVVPILQQPSGNSVLWGGANPWMAAWVEAPPAQGLVPVLAPIGDLDDIAAIDARMALGGDKGALGAYAGRYEAGGAVVAQAQPSGNGSAMTVSVMVSAPGWDPVSTVLSVQGGTGEEAETIYQRGVAAVIALLEEEWTRANLLRYDRAATVLAIRVPLAGLQDLVAVRGALEGAPPVKRVKLTRVTTGEADMDIEFVGDIYQLQTALVQGGLTLDLSDDATSWLVRRAPGG